MSNNFLLVLQILQIMQLDIAEVAASRSFVFLWCGSSEGLDMGRFCLRKWGFRRCEDICWIRTNINNPAHSKNLDPKAVFQRTKVKYYQSPYFVIYQRSWHVCLFNIELSNKPFRPVIVSVSLVS